MIPNFRPIRTFVTTIRKLTVHYLKNEEEIRLTLITDQWTKGVVLVLIIIKSSAT